MAKRNDTEKLDALPASVTDDMLSGDFSQQFRNDSIKVERILLDLVRPDPVQPRRVLPEQIHFAFHNSRLTPTQALKELVQLVQVSARQRGRPFNSVLELLPSADDEHEGDQDTKLSPEEQLLRDLVNLAITIRDDGQVNPLTVVDISQGVSHLFRIETGERRYWAAWLLRDFIPGYDGDGMIPCIHRTYRTVLSFPAGEGEHCSKWSVRNCNGEAGSAAASDRARLRNTQCCCAKRFLPTGT